MDFPGSWHFLYILFCCPFCLWPLRLPAAPVGHQRKCSITHTRTVLCNHFSPSISSSPCHPLLSSELRARAHHRHLFFLPSSSHQFVFNFPKFIFHQLTSLAFSTSGHNLISFLLFWNLKLWTFLFNNQFGLRTLFYQTPYHIRCAHPEPNVQSCSQLLIRPHVPDAPSRSREFKGV